MKNKIAVLLLVFSLAGDFGLVMSASADFKYDWKVKHFDKTSYTDIYLYRLDIRELLVETYDDEQGTTDLESLRGEIVDDIVSMFYRNFSSQIGEVMNLNNAQKIDETRNSLVVEFSISARFVHDDPGLLTRILIKPQQMPSRIKFTAVVREAKTDNAVLEITDVKDLLLEDPEDPLASEKDFQQFTELVEFWSRSCALIIKEGIKE